MNVEHSKMDLKPVAIGLGIIAVVLLITLFYRNQKAADRIAHEQATNASLSMQVLDARGESEENRKSITNLVAELTTLKGDIQSFSNLLGSTLANLEQTQVALKSARADLGQKQEAVVKLESDNQALDSRVKEAEAVNAGLNAQIGELNKSMTALGGDKEALTQELARLSAEKADLEHRFNDLATVRAQVNKLRTEQNVARRLQQAKSGLPPEIEVKGAQKHVMNFPVPSKPVRETHSSPYSLNVEIGDDGSVKAIPPLGKPTR